ncbi:MAG: hypothetical protein KF684_11720 [Phycisphaeraceae bacterium]|nr:hypothetical protein [Phycisphaeraceae bacterium]
MNLRKPFVIALSAGLLLACPLAGSAEMESSSQQAAAGAPESVRLAAFFEAGESMRYSIGIATNVTQTEGEGQPITLRLEQSLTLDLSVASVDERGAVLEGSVVGVKLGTDWRGNFYEYAWPQLTTEAPAVPMPPFVLLRLMGERARESTLRVRVDMPVDSTPGRVTVSGFESPATALDNQAVFDMSVLGMMANEQLGEALTSAFFVEGALDRPRRAKTGWQSTERVEMGAAGAIEIATEWAVDQISNRLAKIDGRPRAAVLPPAATDPTAPTVRIADQSGSVMILWDHTRGLLQRREAKQSITTVWTIGAMSLTQKQETTAAVELLTR